MQQNLTPIIKDSFLQFSGAVLQSRALPDVRDCMKPSARQIFYCLYTDKFVHSKPFQKTLKAIGSAFRMYIHGDSSAEGVIMRAGQPFAMRYPLMEVEGGYGTLIASGSWSAPRYTSARLSKLAEYLFADIDKEVISEWRDNYDNTEQYPMVLPSKGFFNLVNGAYGIGVGASSSIPQYNLRELNEALIKVLWNPDISFDEIYVAPDFATGATIINASQVKESHKNGTGFACKIRSRVDFDPRERCFIVTEIPYMVYTETICRELEDIVNGENNPGIDRFNDLTGKVPNLKIYLSKKANPDKVLKYLYKNTSLESYYGINFTMLRDGRFPETFTWKQVLQAHINHEIDVYVRGFKFDLQKIEARIHIIEGLLRAIDMIDEVVKTIKASNDTKSANLALRALLDIDDIQAKAILDIKLSRLAHLEITKLQNEKSTLEGERERINAILNDETLLKKEVEKGLREVASKFGDARRTQIIDLGTTGEEVIEEKQISLSFTNKGAIFCDETSTLYAQRRNGVGAKFKLEAGEYIVDNIVGKNTQNILFFTDKGNYIGACIGDFQIGEKQYLNSYITMSPNEEVRAATVVNTSKQYVIFVTSQGYLKKSHISEYNMRRKSITKALTLGAGDSIVSVLFTDNEKIGILTRNSNFIMIETTPINPIGRIARGVIGIKLKDGDEVVSARIIPSDTTELFTIAADGYAKRTSLSEFHVTGRGTIGVRVQKADNMVDFLPISTIGDVLIVSKFTQIRINLNEFSLLARGAQGTKSLKIGANSTIIKTSKIG